MSRFRVEISPEEARFMSALYEAKNNPDRNNTQVLAQAADSLNGTVFAFDVDLPELGAARSIRQLDLEKVRRIAGEPQAIIEGRPAIPLRDNLGDSERVTGEIKFNYCSVIGKNSHAGSGITDIIIPLSAIKRVSIVIKTELNFTEKPKSRPYTNRSHHPNDSRNAAHPFS